MEGNATAQLVMLEHVTPVKLEYIVPPFILQEKDSDSTKLFDHELHKAS